MSPMSRSALPGLVVWLLVGVSPGAGLADPGKPARSAPPIATRAVGPPIPAVSAKVAAPAAMAPIPDPPARRAKPRRRLAPAAPPLAALDRANSQARDGPASGVFVNSALFHAFEPGRLYTIPTSPRFLTTIALRPGEKLISKAAGDTVRWVLGETEAGAGDAAQVIVFVKPMRANLRTNIVLTTDQRAYLIDATSTASGAYTSVLSWTYPREEAKARAASAAASSATTPVADLATPVDRLDFRYAIETLKGRSPPWRPVRVFDDGAKTYIEFPPDLAAREAPPLFVLGGKDEIQLVNYRWAGRYIVVDRLIDRAELRLGDRKPVVVRVSHQGARS